jgi:PAS domain S-box-containing protein
MESVSNNIWYNNQETQLVEALNCAALVSITDTKGVIIYANDAFCEISGYTNQELLGKNHNILKSGKQPDSLFEGLWASISMSKVWHGEICNKKKDGTFYWVQVTIIPFLDSSGNIEKHVAIRFDITKRKESNDRVKHVQNKFKYFFDKAPYAFLVTNTSGDIIDCNVTTEILSGYAKTDLVGKNIYELKILSETDHDYFSKILKIGSKNPHKSEFQIIAKNGDKIDVELLSHHIVFEGDTIVLNIVQEITNRKAILNELREKTNDLELLLYRSGHDLRAPFTSLKGLVNLIKEEALDKSTREIIDLFENVLNEGKRLIDNLSTSSIMLNKSIIKEEIDFNQLVNKTINNLSQIEGFDNINFNINISEAFKINSNLQLISSMLQNIIQNAIKYQRPVNDTHTAFVILSAYKTGTGFKICIKDNGIGINTNELDKVFNLYYRSNNTVNGTGLGLYITKNIVEQLSGTIRVKSIINEMTQFDINLPNSI